MPNMQDKDIVKYLTYEELDLIAGDTDDVDYENLLDEEKVRYNQFGDAWMMSFSCVGHLL